MNSCRHLAIIMDGNGRWASARGKPRTAGHFAGADNVRTIAIAAAARGIEYLTIYAFSTENWKRSSEEVGYLMKLPAVFFKKYMQEFLDRGFRIRIIGEMEALPEGTRKVLQDAEDRSAANTGLSLNIAMNYGSRREIVLAARKYAQEVKEGKRENTLEEEEFDRYLFTADLPPVDLMIRTSGECRISNYLLWQIAYAELEFVPEAWPDFTPEVLDRCLEEYSRRDRRYGGIHYEQKDAD